MFLGSGIAYLGKDEIWVRVDRCPHCGARGQLASYTAAKVFRVLGISAVALGKVRIEDDCRLCRRLRVIAYQEWEARRDKVLEDRCAVLEQRPRDVAVALDFLDVVQRYSSLSDLQDEAPGLAERFAENSHVLLALGKAYSYFGEWEQAEAFFAAADKGFELEHQRAVDLLRRGYPAEAEPKLEPIFSERLEGQRDVLYLLVEGYQSRGKMDAAGRVLERIETTWPSQAAEPEHKWLLARNHGRKPVPTVALKHSIKAAPWFTHPVVYGTVLPILFCYGFATFWLGQNREIYLLNGTDAPYDIEIGGKRWTLVPGLPELAKVAEGTIHYKVSDANIPVQKVAIQSFWPVRVFQKRTFVLNPDGLALLHTERTGYSKNPDPNQDQQFQVYPLQPLHEFSDIDLPFEDFPITIQVRTGWLGSLFSDVTYVRRLDVFTGGPSHLLELVAQDKATGEEYLESALRISPSQELIDRAEENMPTESLLDAANRHLEAVPVETAWHILYQDLSWSSRNLELEYRERLSRSPKDPELQFLLARMVGDETMLKDKPLSQFAVLHQARMALANGDFSRAEELSRGRTPALRAIFADSLMAQRRYQDLLSLSLEDSQRMLAWEAAGKEKEAEHCAKAAVPSRRSLLAMELAYAQGREIGEDKEEPVLSNLLAGNWQKARPELKESPSWTLHLSLYLMSRDRSELARAIELLRVFPPFSAEFQAAQFLRHPDPKAARLCMSFKEKRLLLAALCLLDARHRESYRPLAQKLNFEKSFPYWTIKKVLE